MWKNRRLVHLIFVLYCFWDITEAFSNHRRGFALSRDVIISRQKLRRNSQLNFSRYDNLISGVAEISMGMSIGTLWSEFSVIVTGCGPIQMSDFLERFCYEGVIAVSCAMIFMKIVSGKSLTVLSDEYFDGLLRLEDSTLLQVSIAEALTFLAVVGAFVALGSQISNGVDMNGLSGIDIEMCRAVRSLG